MRDVSSTFGRSSINVCVACFIIFLETVIVFL